MPTLKTTIAALADTFAAGVLAAIRSASLEEILSGDGATPAKRGPGRPPKTANGAQLVPGGGGMPDPLAAPKGAKRGKRARRTAADIEPVINLIVAKLKEHKGGLRSEQLQKVLKLTKKDIVRPISEALAKKRITKKGEKRSTTYFAR